MEKLKIGKEKTEYSFESILPMSATVLRIVFADLVPESWGDITLITAGGVETTVLTGYETVYRQEGKTVYLSNDGSVYVAPETPESPGEPQTLYEPTVGEMQAAKRREISEACEKIIYRGINVTLANGSTAHYSLTQHDQLNLFGKQSQLLTGATQLEYHADGELCQYYTAADMAAIIQAAMRHISYHTTYCNALNMWIAGCETTEDVQVIFYGADVPEEYQSDVLKSYLLQIAAMEGENNADRT